MLPSWAVAIFEWTVLAAGLCGLVLGVLWLVSFTIKQVLDHVKAQRLLTQFIIHRVRLGHFPCRHCVTCRDYCNECGKQVAAICGRCANELDTSD